MKIVCISDSHGINEKAELPDGDVLIHAGDLSLLGLPHEIQHALAWLRKQPHKHKFVIGGNHDNALAEMPMLFDEQWKPYKDLTPIQYLCGSMAKFREEDKVWRVFGSSVIPFNRLFRAGARAYMLDGTTARHWNYAPPSDILITHTPPAGVLDGTYGDPCLRAHVDQTKPRLHVFGHVHIGYGVSHGCQNNPVTTFVNAAQVNENYFPTNEPIVVEV